MILRSEQSLILRKAPAYLLKLSQSENEEYLDATYIILQILSYCSAVQ